VITGRRTRCHHEVWLSVQDEDDVPRYDESHGTLVVDLVHLEYRRETAKPDWRVVTVDVIGRPRLRGGGVGDDEVNEFFVHRMGLIDRPGKMPPWLRRLVQEGLPT